MALGVIRSVSRSARSHRPARGHAAKGDVETPARSGTRALRQRVYALVRRVPAGRVVTYGQVAALAGVPRAARAVGQAMRVCPAGVPWHRVVNGQGTISRRGDGSGALSQRLLLEGEGVRFARGRIDLRRYRWPAAGRSPSGTVRRFRPELLA